MGTTTGSVRAVLVALYIVFKAQAVSMGLLTKDIVANYSGPCDHAEYNTDMLPYYEFLANGNLTAARTFYEDLKDKLNNYTDVNELKDYVQNICFAAAFQCQMMTYPNKTTGHSCGCLEITKKNFTFTKAEDETCKAAKGTPCTPKGYKCAKGLVCEDNVCTKASASFIHLTYWSAASWQVFSIVFPLFISTKTPFNLQFSSFTS